MPASLLRILLLRAGIESNPGPGQAQQQPATTQSFSLVQINICGLRGKMDTLIDYITRNNIFIAAVQETLLRPNTTLWLPSGFSIVRADRPADRDKRGGLAFIIHQSVNFKTHQLPLTTDPHLDQQAIVVNTGSMSITIINLYCPPASSCSPGYQLSLDLLLQLEDTVILRDINAHHELWFSELSKDTHGGLIAREIEGSTFAVLNEDSATRVTASTSSSPDISLASLALFPGTTWETAAALGSDHMAILVSLQRESIKVTNNCTFINFSKADWPAFTGLSEEAFGREPTPTNVYVGERRFRQILKKAAARTIPAGCIREVRPFFPTKVAVLAQERDDLQANLPGDPCIPQLTKEINKEVTSYQQHKWEEYLGGVDLKSGAKCLWSRQPTRDLQ